MFISTYEKFERYIPKNHIFWIYFSIFLVCRGGWALSFQIDEQVALDVTWTTIKVAQLWKTNKNHNKSPDVMLIILLSYASNIFIQAAY